MKIAYHAIYILIITALLLLNVVCNNHPPCPEIEKIKIVYQDKPKTIAPVGPENVSADTSYKPTPKKVIASKPKPKVQAPPSYGYELVWPENYQATETVQPCSELQEEYYTKRYYNESYQDSAMNITVEDSISENQIQWRKVGYKRLVPDKQVITGKPRTKLYLGMQIGSNFDKIPDFGPNAMLVNKRDQAFFIHWNALDKPVNLTLGGYWLLSFRRR